MIICLGPVCVPLHLLLPFLLGLAHQYGWLTFIKRGRRRPEPEGAAWPHGRMGALHTGSSCGDACAHNPAPSPTQSG
jgi:hypothetical protein